MKVTALLLAFAAAVVINVGLPLIVLYAFTRYLIVPMFH